ncbi:hypothetical protein P7C70_g6861, partial [Phenoliferia sp. Uapishka_3]
MYPLESYRGLVDLSPPSAFPADARRNSLITNPDVVALAFLYAEHTHDTEDSDTPTEHELSHLPPRKRHHLIKSLLTLRHPRLGPLPPEIMAAIDTHLNNVSQSNPDPLVPTNDIPSIPTALFPSVPEPTLPRTLSRLSFFRGDVTRISSDTLAIVNPVNTQMLGCFQPSHLCADNVIHSAAGPRVRLDCFRILQTNDYVDAEVGEAIVTKAYSLPSAYILHAAGPQLERGAEPTDLEVHQLKLAYKNCLDLAEVAFTCLSTGLFAFPGDQASRIALTTTIEWIDTHPSSFLRVIFVFFSEADAKHYLLSLASIYPALPPPLPLKRHVRIPERVREWFDNSASVIIHAGAGLSADAVNRELGLTLDYTSRELFKKLYPALLKSTEMRMLYHSMGYNFDDDLVKWAFILAHGGRVLSWGHTPVYSKLLAYALSKCSYSIMTSNADQLFVQGNFDQSRIFTPQGSYSLFQCLKPCTPDSFFPSQPWIDRARPFIDPQVMRLPESRRNLIPTCEKCGGPVFFNVRGGDWFLETPQAGQRERYEQQVEEMVHSARAKGKVVLLLELGAGFNTPSVIRFPSERLVRKYPGIVKLLRINAGFPEVPSDMEENAVGLRMGAVEFFDSLC